MANTRTKDLPDQAAQDIADATVTPDTAPTPEAPTTGQPTPETPVQAEAEAEAAGQPETGEPDLEFIKSGAFTLDASLAKTTAPQRARSERQAAMDDIVAKAHDHWTTVGRPSTWGKMVETGSVTTYFVQPDAVARMKNLINRAGQLHGVAIRYGTPFVLEDSHLKKFGLPDNYLGREVLSFAAKDKRAYQPSEQVKANVEAVTGNA